MRGGAGRNVRRDRAQDQRRSARGANGPGDQGQACGTRRLRASRHPDRSAGVCPATPAEIVEKLNKEINAALADHKIKARLADLGSTPLVGSATDFGKLIADDTEKWRKVIREANIRAE
jgi:hypothetical protein